MTHEEVVQAFRDAIHAPATRSAVLLCVYRGKCSEGISYNDDMCRLALCVGIPYPNLFDACVTRKKDYNDDKIKGGRALGCGAGNQPKADVGVMSGNTWYQVQAFRALNQALGRCLRHLDDYGAVVLLDSRFQEPSARMHVAKWIRHAVQPASLDNTVQHLRRHFQRAPQFVKRDYRERMGLPPIKIIDLSLRQPQPQQQQQQQQQQQEPQQPQQQQQQEQKPPLQQQPPSAQAGKKEAAATQPTPPRAAAAPFVYEILSDDDDDDEASPPRLTPPPEARADASSKRPRLSEASRDRLGEIIDLPQSFYCPINHSVMIDPVVCSDGHTYEREFIEQWLKNNATSPLTNLKLDHTHLTPNITLRKALDELISRRRA